MQSEEHNTGELRRLSSLLSSLFEVARELLRPRALLTAWKVTFFACYTAATIETAGAVLSGRPFGVADLLADPLVRLLAVVAVGIHLAWWARMLLDREGSGRAAIAAEVARLAALQSALLRDAEETGIRVAAVRALGNLRERAPVSTLQNVAERDENPRVRDAAAEALLMAQGPRLSYGPAMQALRDAEPSVRESGARALAALAQLREQGSGQQASARISRCISGRVSGAPLPTDSSLLAATQARGALAALGIEAPYVELLDPA